MALGAMWHNPRMGLGVAVLAIWVYLLIARGLFWRMRDEAAPGHPNSWPRIVAVIPARNESDVIEAAVSSLAKQHYSGPFHIVVVDDHSTDGTADCARFAAPEDRLSVIAAAPLPPGWSGKLWAVAEGVRFAARFEPDYLLLTDADIVHGTTTLSQLVVRAESGSDLASYMATLRCESQAERALIPAFVFFFFMLYPPAWGTGAAGGCMLIRHTMLEAIGGIDRIRGEWIDDCALAREVRRHGGRVWLGLSAETRSIRPYGTFAETGRMISRSAFTQLRHSVSLLVATAIGLLLTFAAAPVLALLGSWWGAAAWILMTALYVPALRFYRVSVLRAPLLPLVALFYLGATVHSAVMYWRGRGGLWKGRVQPSI
jgi:hopene-associated glycosyltransferase HpnB